MTCKHQPISPGFGSANSRHCFLFWCRKMKIKNVQHSLNIRVCTSFHPPDSSSFYHPSSVIYPIFNQCNSPPGCVRVRSFLAGSVAKLSTNKVRHYSVRPPLATQQGGIQVYCAGASQFGLAAAQSTTQ